MNHAARSVGPFSRRAALIAAAQVTALFAASCAMPSTGVEPPAPTATPPAPTPAVACANTLAPVNPPTPIPYPGYVQVEPSTGLHVTTEPQWVDLATYRLTIKGKVTREVSLSYDDIRCLPRVAAQTLIECPGFFVDQSNLAGGSLVAALALAEPLADAERVLFVGVDGRSDSVKIDSARATDNFLAYEWEGDALPISHGFPVRLALPGYTGGYWIKWLNEITVL